MPDSNLKQIQFLYKELLASSDSLKRFIEIGDFNGLANLLDDRSKLLSTIRAFQSSYGKPLPEEFNELIAQIDVKERENLELMEQYQGQILTELKKVRKQESFLKAYSGVIHKSGKLLDKSE